jgi:hypothetical protein
MGETTITGGVAVLTWCCRTCGRDWLITSEDQLPERRMGARERRRESRVGP